MAKQTGRELLKERVGMLGWTQAELAERLGVPSASVSRWLAGERRPTLEMAARIRDVTGVPLEAWLVERGTGTDG